VHAVYQNRLLILEMQSGRLTAATLLVDRETIGGNRYFLLADYSLEGGNQMIRYRAVRDGGDHAPMGIAPRWAGLSEEIVINDVDRLLFAYLKCPRDDRRDGQRHGVPITYGAEKLIREITEHAAIYRREYKLTRPMLGLDASLWRDEYQDGASIKAIRRSVQDSDEPFVPMQITSMDGSGTWQYYAPEIRQKAMEERLMSLYRRIEKVCGLSQGVLTERQALSYANKDEVRAAQYDTYSTIKNMRTAWETAFDDLAYAVDALAEAYGLTPAGSRGQYELSFDWDTSMVESSTEAFQQNVELANMGAMSKAELRQWVLGGTLEENEEAVAGIGGNDDVIGRILGASEE